MLHLLMVTQCEILGKALLKSVGPLGYTVFQHGQRRRALSPAWVTLTSVVTADTWNLFLEFLVVVDILAEVKQPCQRVVQCLNKCKIHPAQLRQQGKADIPGYQQHCRYSRLAWRKRNSVVPTISWVMLNHYEGYRTRPVLGLTMPTQGAASNSAAHGRLVSCTGEGRYGHVPSWQLEGTPHPLGPCLDQSTWGGDACSIQPCLVAAGWGWLAEVCDTIKSRDAGQLALVKVLTASLPQVCCDWQSLTEHTVAWEFLLFLCFREVIFPFLVWFFFFFSEESTGQLFFLSLSFTKQGTLFLMPLV